MTMMASLKRWINDVAQQEDASSRVDLSLATAVLLCEVIRADYRLDDSEIHLMRSQLKEQFELEDEALDELMTLAREEAEGAVDHHRFVRELRDRTGYQDRVALVQQMWALAFADGEKDALEEHRIRALAELLHVSHSDFVRIRIVEQNRAEGV
ncbi:tellurite resistance TerB family protein [Halomonas sp. S2151]|uniref:tellurite resistance TerB family protein n=1 Tax=Halomonas sp. S2151 TaxID=579478 RepID=UPI000A9F9E60|nr:TerB family tellurite resistance protein [Halomonas sp. S2151]